MVGVYLFIYFFIIGGVDYVIVFGIVLWWFLGLLVVLLDLVIINMCLF